MKMIGMAKRSKAAKKAAKRPSRGVRVAKPIAARGAKAAAKQPYAGFWVRLGAFLIDMIFTIVAGVTIPYVGAAAAIIFNLYLIYTRGYSLGKSVFNLRIVKEDGSRLDIVDVVLREIIGKFVSGLVFGLGFLLILIDARKQGLHDKIAHTVVKTD
jgi:uncharacterized RDD family membrane protein YckC